MSSLRKNVASQHIGFCLNNLTTGAPVTAGGAGNVVIDGGSQNACAGTFTHKGTGQWDYAPTQAETNGTNVSFAFTGTSAIQVGMTFFTIGYDPTVANLPANLIQVNAHAVTDTTSGIPDVNAKNINNVVAPTLTGDAFARLGAPAGASVSADIAAVKSETDTILTDVNTGGGAIYSRLGAPAGASMSADIASVKSSVGSVTNPVTVGTNNDKTGYSLTQTFPTNFAILSIDGSGGVSSASNVKKNVLSNGFMFVMTDSTTHAPKTGLTVTAQRSIDGAAFGSCANAVTEVANGTYTLNLAATDVNGNHIMCRFTATGADDRNIEIITQP